MVLLRRWVILAFGFKCTLYSMLAVRKSLTFASFILKRSGCVDETSSEPELGKVLGSTASSLPVQAVRFRCSH